MATNHQSIIQIQSEEALCQFAVNLIPFLTPGLVIGLNGDLGTGKTTFVRCLGTALGSLDWINSPTYTLVQTYVSPTLHIAHFDFYRCTSDAEIDQINVMSYLTKQSILLIEWLNKTTIISPDITIDFSLINQHERQLTIESESHAWVSALNNTHPN